jgi:hypothetical protein
MADPSHVYAQIAKQIFIALQRRGADKLLSIIESHGDTLSNAEILLLLQEYNATGRVLHQAQMNAGRVNPAGHLSNQPAVAPGRWPGQMWWA